MREYDIKKIIYCPVCGNKFHKAIYDFSFVHCNDGCRTVFHKETGEILGFNDDFSRAHQEVMPKIKDYGQAMEKNIRTSNLDIVIKRQKGAVIFEIKDPAQLNKSLLNDIKRDFFLIKKDSIVIHPEQEIVDTQGVFLEDTSRLI